MMTPGVATSWYRTLLLFSDIQMKGLVPRPMSLQQVSLLTSMGRKRPKQAGSCMTLGWLGTGTGLGALSWRIEVLGARIVAGPLGIWSGCSSRVSDGVRIASVLRKAMSAFRLVWTGVRIHFGPWMWIEFGTGSRFFQTFLLSISDNFWLGLCFSFVVTVTYFRNISIIALWATSFCSWFCWKWSICCYTEYWLSGFGITVLPKVL